MDNKQGTVIGLGLLALSSLYYFFYQSDISRKQYKIKKKQLESAYKDYKDHLQIPKGEEKKKVFIEKIQSFKLNSDSFYRMKRDVKLSQLPNFVNNKHAFEQSQSGGSIFANYKQKSLRIELKQCAIQKQLIKQLGQRQLVFQENKEKTPQFLTMHSFLKDTAKLALYGSITYSITENRFILYPQFLSLAELREQDTLQTMTAFWDEKIYQCTFKKIAIGLAMGMTLYFFVYRPIKSIWLRYREKFKDLGEAELDHFKAKANYSAKISSALNCELCKNNIISYVYECGHLIACEQCHIDNSEKRCPICQAISKKYLKVYI